MKKNLNELLVEKEFTKWLRSQKALIKDIRELNSLVLRFEIMYGITLELVYDDKKEPHE